MTTNLTDMVTWLTSTSEGNELITQVAQDIVADVAPDEIDLFEELIQEYFDDSTPPDFDRPTIDDPLGFGGAELIVAATPAATAAVTAVLGFVLAGFIEAVQEKSFEYLLQRLWGLIRGEQNGSVALSSDQLMAVHQIAQEQALQYGVDSDVAHRIATSVVGRLALNDVGVKHA